MRCVHWRRLHDHASRRPVAVAVELAAVDLWLGGVGRQLTANGGDVGEAAFASSLIEPELHWLLGNGQQCELLRVVVEGRTLGHSAIIAKGCDTVTG